MVKVIWVVDPAQVNPAFTYCGVTVKVATNGAALLALSAVKAAMFPDPEANKPMAAVLFAQL
jgi:hypothetical protein